MRRYADDDEVDVVIVGCGAGGGTLVQRLARAGWRVVGAGRRAVLGSRRRLGQRRSRLPPPVLDRATGHRRRRSGSARIEQLRPRGGRVDGPLRRLHAAVPPLRLPHPQRRRRRRRLADHLRGPPALLRADRSRTAGLGPGLAVGRPAPLSATPPTRSAATARSPCAAPGARASRPGSARSPSPTAASGTVPTASTAGSASRAAKSTPRPPR